MKRIRKDIKNEVKYVEIGYYTSTNKPRFFRSSDVFAVNVETEIGEDFCWRSKKLTLGG